MAQANVPFLKFIFRFSTLLVAQVSSYILPAGWNYIWPWFFPCLLTHTFSFLLLSLSVLRTKPRSSTLPSQSKQQLKAMTYKSVRSQRSQDQIEIKQSLLSQQQHCNSASPWNISVHLNSLLSTHSPGKVDAISFIIISRSEKIESPHPM